MHNKQRNRKAFTIVELVIVIAVIAVLAAVMIPTFAGLIEQAEYSAYLQERTNQLIQDMIEKSKDPDYFTWEDFEDALNKHFPTEEDKKDELTREDILNIIKWAIDEYAKNHEDQNTGLTQNQIQAIIQQILKEQGFGDTLTKDEIKDIIEDILGGGEVPPTTAPTEPTPPATSEPTDPSDPDNTDPDGTESTTPTETECRHIYVYDYNDEIDAEKHTKTCRECGVETEEDHLYAGDNRVCICTKVKTYAYYCTNRTQECTECPHTFTKAELDSMTTMCGIGNPGHGSHPKCFECGGCLVEVDPCDHAGASKEPTSTGSNSIHNVTCNECHESFTEDHTFQSDNNQICTECRHCTHKRSNGVSNYGDYYSVDGEKHARKCAVCQNVVTYHHTMAATPNDDGETHTLSCTAKGCGYTITEEHEWSAKHVCVDCKASQCDHTGRTNPRQCDKDYHYEYCAECESDVLVKHKTVTNGYCDCGAYFASGTISSEVTISKEGCTVYLKGASLTGSGKFIVAANNVTIDMNGSSLSAANTSSLPAAIVVNDGVTGLTIKNSATNGGVIAASKTGQRPIKLLGSAELTFINVTVNGYTPKYQSPEKPVVSAQEGARITVTIGNNVKFCNTIVTTETAESYLKNDSVNKDTIFVIR